MGIRTNGEIQSLKDENAKLLRNREHLLDRVTSLKADLNDAARALHKYSRMEVDSALFAEDDTEQQPGNAA
jgi:hypothetical protein